MSSLAVEDLFTAIRNMMSAWVAKRQTLVVIR
jgi:hypothetical protein